MKLFFNSGLLGIFIQLCLWVYLFAFTLVSNEWPVFNCQLLLFPWKVAQWGANPYGSLLEANGYTTIEEAAKNSNSGVPAGKYFDDVPFLSIFGMNIVIGFLLGGSTAWLLRRFRRRKLYYSS